jgi:hypothetical protein
MRIVSFAACLRDLLRRSVPSGGSLFLGIAGAAQWDHAAACVGWMIE